MTIYAHRANVVGPDRPRENSLMRTEECVGRGWTVETDIRRDPEGRFYVSHDPANWSPENAAEAFCPAWRRATGLVALNVKELGYESDLLAFLDRHGVLGNVFLFDMELLEAEKGATAKRMHEADRRAHLAARVSDRGEPVSQALAISCASTIWLDEFDGPWASAEDVARLRRHKSKIIAVSPDLHGRSLEQSLPRWKDLLEWGVDGICTDYPEHLSRIAS